MMAALQSASSARDKRLFISIFLAFSLLFPGYQVKAQTPQLLLYLPLVATSPIDQSISSGWKPNDQEQQLEVLFRNDPEQHRKNPQRNAILAQVARARAQDMAERNYFNHTDPDGHQANFLVKQAGYPLPNYFPANGNNIESIGLNYTAAAEVWEAWKSSPAHRTHVLGEDRFFADEVDYGMGYAENSTSKYWVIITAHD